MTILRKRRRSAWLSVTSALVATALTAVAVPASADDIGVLQLQQANGILSEVTNVAYHAEGGYPLLDHFWFRDVNGDQHLATLSALPNSGMNWLRVGFSDKSQFEQFEYRVAHQRVPTAQVVPGTLTERCHGSCEARITPPRSGWVFVLGGFQFRYMRGNASDDHHIDEIGIIEENGLLRHWFNDQNDDDEYEVTIEYAWVDPAHLTNLTTLTGTVHATDRTSRDIRAGDKVIRGFHVDNLASGGAGDNHIKRFGFQTNTTDVDIYYGDLEPGDSADWSYKFKYGLVV